MTLHDPQATLRLNKYIALQTGVSRREADNLIEKGSVTINDGPVTLGARYTEGDDIKINGVSVASNAALEYVMFNKPFGYVCSRRDQGDSPTIYAILPPEFHKLKPVGRLDRNSSGLILLTNDGDFAYQMTHPKFTKVKIYNVRLDIDLEPLHHQMIVDYGVTLEDGISKFQLEKISEDSSKSWKITMTEGRNRQIRRTFGALGYTVTKLHRTDFGNYSLGDIASGKYEIVNIR